VTIDLDLPFCPAVFFFRPPQKYSVHPFFFHPFRRLYTTFSYPYGPLPGACLFNSESQVCLWALPFCPPIKTPPTGHIFAKQIAHHHLYPFECFSGPSLPTNNLLFFFFSLFIPPFTLVHFFYSAGPSCCPGRHLQDLAPTHSPSCFSPVEGVGLFFPAIFVLRQEYAPPCLTNVLSLPTQYTS